MMNQSEAGYVAVASGTAGFGTTQGFIRGLISRGVSGIAGAGFFVYGLVAKHESEQDRNVVSAIEARLSQLQSIEDGTCLGR